MTDGNGDQLPDVSIDGKVLFNHINANGQPQFTVSSEPTENLVVVGAEVKKTIPDTWAEFDFELPSYDVVKTWEAPSDGYIIIDNLNVSSGAKVSIEAEHNGLYGLASLADVVGTCRLWEGMSENLPASINSLPGSGVGLPCVPKPGIDSCTLDSNGNGINDCIDCITNPQMLCDYCPDSVFLTNIVNPQASELHKYNINIRSSQRYTNNSSGTHIAGDSLMYVYNGSKGFEVVNNATFFGTIGDCDNNMSSGGSVPDSPSPPLNSSLYVKKGQKLFFRSHSFGTDPSEEKNWDAQNRYTKVYGLALDPEDLDHNGHTTYKSAYSDGFVVSGFGEVFIPSGGENGTHVNVVWEDFTVADLTDDVDLKVIAVKRFEDDNTPNQETVLWQKLIPANSSPILVSSSNSIELNLQGGENVSLRFEAKSTSNVDWQSIDWDPVVKTTMTSRNADNEVQNEDIIQVPDIGYTLYKTYTGNFLPTNPHKVKSYNTIKLNYDPAVKKYYVFPYLNAFSPAMLPPCTASTGCEAGKVYFVVKQNGVFLGRRLITINTNNSLSLDNNQAIPVQISDEASRYITIELNADGSYRSQQFLHLIDFRLLATLSGLPLALIGDVEYYPEIIKKNYHALCMPQVTHIC